MTSDVQNEPWEHMGSPQLKFDTNRLLMSFDTSGTEKNQLTSYVCIRKDTVSTSSCIPLYEKPFQAIA